MMRELTAPDGLDAVAAAPVAVLYKHSPRCGASHAAESEVARFAGAHPEIPVFRLDVVRSRALARLAAARFGVRHASPQVLLLRDGRAAWSGSHWEVDARALERELAAGPAA